MLTSIVSPWSQELWRREGLVLVTQSVFTLRLVPAVLIWPLTLTCWQTLVSSFCGCSLSPTPAWATLGSIPLNRSSVTTAPYTGPAPLRATFPSPVPTARAAVLAFYGLVSHSPRPVLTGPLAWLPASWQAQHVKYRPGRGMELGGTDFLSASPS